MMTRAPSSIRPIFKCSASSRGSPISFIMIVSGQKENTIISPFSSPIFWSSRRKISNLLYSSRLLRFSHSSGYSYARTRYTSRLGTPDGGVFGGLTDILYLVMNPTSIMNLSRRFKPFSLKIPDKIGASFIFSKGPARSRNKSPTPEPSCPSRITSSALNAIIGDKGSSLVSAIKRHIIFSP